MPDGIVLHRKWHPTPWGRLSTLPGWSQVSIFDETSYSLRRRILSKPTGPDELSSLSIRTKLSYRDNCSNLSRSGVGKMWPRILGYCSYLSKIPMSDPKSSNSQPKIPDSKKGFKIPMRDPRFSKINLKFRKSRLFQFNSGNSRSLRDLNYKLYYASINSYKNVKNNEKMWYFRARQKKSHILKNKSQGLNNPKT